MRKPKPAPQPQTRLCWGCLTKQPSHLLNRLRVCQGCRDAVHSNPRSVATREYHRRRRESQS